MKKPHNDFIMSKLDAPPKRGVGAEWGTNGGANTPRTPQHSAHPRSTQYIDNTRDKENLPSRSVVYGPGAIPNSDVPSKIFDKIARFPSTGIFDTSPLTPALRANELPAFRGDNHAALLHRPEPLFAPLLTPFAALLTVLSGRFPGAEKAGHAD